MEIRRLGNGDLAALDELLASTEAQSLFLIGNARTHGLEDRGGPLQGHWFGAFEGGSLRGVVAWTRAFDSVLPACEGHGGELIEALARELGRPPGMIIGTGERVAEVLAHAPASWVPAKRKRELLLVLEWDLYRPRPLEGTGPARAGEIPSVGAMIHALHREAGSPSDAGTCLEQARRLVGEGSSFVARIDGDAVATSQIAASTGRYVHVGATYCEPSFRRRGLAGACVTAVLSHARVAAMASKGAALFTDCDNTPAIALYEALGFRRDAAWEMCFLESA